MKSDELIPAPAHTATNVSEENIGAKDIMANMLQIRCNAPLCMKVLVSMV